MTEIEAIEIVRKEKAYMDSHAGRTQSEAFQIAINALEKQIPKKIAKYNVCPACNNNQSTTWYYVGSSYCEICGQKLDWK